MVGAAGASFGSDADVVAVFGIVAGVGVGAPAEKSRPGTGAGCLLTVSAGDTVGANVGDLSLGAPGVIIAGVDPDGFLMGGLSCNILTLSSSFEFSFEASAFVATDFSPSSFDCFEF